MTYLRKKKEEFLFSAISIGGTKEGHGTLFCAKKTNVYAEKIK